MHNNKSSHFRGAIIRFSLVCLEVHLVAQVSFNEFYNFSVFMRFISLLVNSNSTLDLGKSFDLMDARSDPYEFKGQISFILLIQGEDIY